jgi:hypothetical protein
MPGPGRCKYKSARFFALVDGAGTDIFPVITNWSRSYSRSASVALAIIAVVLVLSAIVAALMRRVASKAGASMFALSIVLCGLGVLLVITQSSDIEQARVRLHWPTVEGVVTASRVVGKRAYHPHIEYAYIVGQTTYHDSTTLDLPSFGGRPGKYDAAEKVAGEYPVGKKVVVHYNPADPGESGLREFPSWAVYGKMSLGVLLAAVGIFGVIGFFMKASESTSPPADVI